MGKTSYKMRKTTSIILALSFVILSVTGIQLKVEGPARRVAMIRAAAGDMNATPQTPFYPKKAHEWLGYIFIIAGVAHTAFNIKPMMLYIKGRP